MKTNTTKKIVSGIMSLAMIAGLASCTKYPEKGTYSIDINHANTQSTIFDDFKDKVEVGDLYKDENTTTNTVANNGYVKCSDPNFKLSSGLIQKINNTINNFDKDDIAFKMEDVVTGTTFSYNTGQTFNGACIVKTSVVLYLLKLAEAGYIDINKTIPYPGNIAPGSGYLNGYYNGYQARTGQLFSIYEYMYYCQYYSDNNAYRVLWKYLINSPYYDAYVRYMNGIDAKSLCVGKNIMWVRAAKAGDTVNVMKSLRAFCHSSTKKFNVNKTFVDGNNLKKMSNASYNDFTLGQVIYWIMRYSKYDYFEQRTGYKAISKTGFVSGSGDYSCRNGMSIFYTPDGMVYASILTKYHSASGRTAAVNGIIDSMALIEKEYKAYCIRNGLTTKALATDTKSTKVLTKKDLR
ncbi:MAG TPA: serine hydrolase [Bacilli bacterium]|nr:serine hydrolase [Bacilli bacterium]